MIDKQFIITKDDEWTESAENEPPADETWPEEMPGDEQCADKFERRNSAPFIKPRGHCVQEVMPNGDIWDV